MQTKIICGTLKKHPAELF